MPRCTSTPLPSTPIPVPAQIQTNNGSFSEADLLTWLKQYKVTYGQPYRNGECKILANALVANMPGYRSYKVDEETYYTGAKQYVDEYKPPLLKDIKDNVNECDVILFISDNYLKYSKNGAGLALGHTAVVYKQYDDGTIYIVEQNNPTGTGVVYRPLKSSDYNNDTYVIQKDCNSIPK